MPETLTRRQRRKIEELCVYNRDYSTGGIVIDEDKCTGCGMCAAICPGSAILFTEDKTPELKPGIEGLCMSCGDCSAICPADAITITQFIQFDYYFHYLDRGEPKPPRQF